MHPGFGMHQVQVDEGSKTIHQDARIRKIVWKDLVAVTWLETIWELLLPALWLGASLLAAAYSHYVVALGCSFFFFLTGLRLVHNAFHLALGLSRKTTDLVLWIMSFIMLGSMHAVQYNHLRHHKLSLGEGDVEGRSAEMAPWGALLYGPVFPVLLHVTAIRKGNRTLRKTVYGELLMTLVWVLSVFGLFHSSVLRYHVTAMLIAQCFTAFFAVWTVHHHCDRTHYIARTLRNRVKNAISFNMFLHIEHHLFPRVPTCHLQKLSQRIDEAAPELKKKIVF